MITFEERFLQAAQTSYEMFLEHGPRSNEKLKDFHGWVQDELKRELDDDYNFMGYMPDDGKEALDSGLYYDKRVDVLISLGGQELDVVSIKFIISNYWQNSVIYLEQQIGEIANLLRKKNSHLDTTSDADTAAPIGCPKTDTHAAGKCTSAVTASGSTRRT